MKGLDTPVLLEILHDTPPSRGLLKSLRGEELATTELNMFELSSLASAGARPSRSARQKALVALRRRITVVPISPAAVEEASIRLAHLRSADGYAPLIWGAMLDAGCGEWICLREDAPPKGIGLKVRIV
jgi:predicted nucleic acid-binding protein